MIKYKTIQSYFTTFYIAKLKIKLNCIHIYVIFLHTFYIVLNKIDKNLYIFYSKNSNIKVYIYNKYFKHTTNASNKSSLLIFNINSFSKSNSSSVSDSDSLFLVSFSV